MIDTYRLIGPALRRLDVERAHRLALFAVRRGIAQILFPAVEDPQVLGTDVWGKAFANPIGLAAGFDKNAEAFGEALALGFGFVEVGGVTPKPQSGNPSPRVFRLSADRAIINRMGFNNDGLSAVASRLENRTSNTKFVGVNFGKNKESTDAISDYATLARGFAAIAGFLVINVSSPNTPGLRSLQNIEPLIEIVRAVRSARDATVALDRPPILLKISPDLDASEVSDITKVALEEHLDGLIVSNTTLARPASLKSPKKDEVGGLSGAPLFDPSTRLLRHVYQMTKGAIPLIGVGGVSSGADAYEKIRAGASLVQLYTALVFDGPAVLGRIKRDLAALLERDGYTSVGDAVGADCQVE
jgi:dihydroorotate dehydrogenase